MKNTLTSTITTAYIIFFVAVIMVIFSPPGYTEIKTQNAPSTSRKPLPRFVSLRAAKVNLRTGPGVRYPIDWVYQSRHLPVEVTLEFGTWRKIRDVQGTQGWIHESMLSTRRMFIVTGKMRTVRNQDDSKSRPIAKLENYVIGELKYCPDATGWCKVSVDKYEGWLRRVEFWGIYPREKIK
jgi:SH3-like domain-containing protein